MEPLTDVVEVSEVLGCMLILLAPTTLLAGTARARRRKVAFACNRLAAAGDTSLQREAPEALS
jgi:hypothetical protein